MKTFWRTQETYDDKGRVTVCMAGMVQAEEMPESECIERKRFDVWYDYHKSQRDALNLINERKKDGATSGTLIKPSLSAFG